MNEGKTLVFNEKIIDGWTEEYDYNRELGKTKLKPEIKEKVKDNNLTEKRIGDFFTIVLWIIGIFLLAVLLDQPRLWLWNIILKNIERK